MNASTPRPWTPAEDDAIRSLIAATPLAEIGHSLRRTISSVSRRAGRLGLGRHEARRDACRDRFVALLAAGASARSIARSLGVAHKSAKKWMAEAGAGVRLAPTPVARTIVVRPRMPRTPTATRPGTAEKQEVMAARVARGERPHHPMDAGARRAGSRVGLMMEAVAAEMGGGA